MRGGGAAIKRMCATTRELDLAGGRQAMSELIGLGEGSTPAGDDYLVGYFGGLWACAGADGLRRRFIADLGGSLGDMVLRTNRISRVYLEAAAEGEVSERLATLVWRIAAGADEKPVAAATALACAVGHSSGACGVLSLLLGCAAWGPADRPWREPDNGWLANPLNSGYEGPIAGRICACRSRLESFATSTEILWH